MICIKCKRELPNDSEYCQYCGKKLEEQAIIQKETKAVTDDIISVTNENGGLNLTNTAPNKVLDAIIKDESEEMTNAFKENNAKYFLDVEDDFGLVPENPIYTLALMSVNGEKEYLNRLYTENGVKIKWNRRSSISVKGISGMIDIYDTYLPTGELYKTIYINMYGTKKSKKAPSGFILSGVDSNKIKSKKEKKKKIKFCSRCGSQVDSKSNMCSSCGRKIFKYFITNKSNWLKVLCVIIFCTLIVFNIIQSIKINQLELKIKNTQSSFCDLEEYIDDLERSVNDIERTVDDIDDRLYDLEWYGW